LGLTDKQIRALIEFDASVDAMKDRRAVQPVRRTMRV